jgi:Tol biopolymer transport system component
LPLTNQSAWLESWSPTSDSILYWGPTAQDSNAAPHVQRYILSSGETIDLGGGADQTDYSAVWSPSGDWIAVDRVVSTSVNAVKGDQVWLVRPDGTGAQVLLGEDQKSYSDLSWSPDGKYIVYARYDYQNAGHFDVGLVNVQTGEQVILVSGGSLPSLLP